MTAASSVPTFTCRWCRDTFWIAAIDDQAANRAYWAERDHHERAACIGYPGDLPQLVDVGAARAAVVAIAAAVLALLACIAATGWWLA